MLGRAHDVSNRGRRQLKAVESLGVSARCRCEDQTTTAQLAVILEVSSEEFTMPSQSASSPSTKIQCRRFCSASGTSLFGPCLIRDLNSSLGFTGFFGGCIRLSEGPTCTEFVMTASLLERARVCFCGEGIAGTGGGGIEVIWDRLVFRCCSCRCCDMREGPLRAA